MPEPFVHRLRVRYGECDPQGFVFNANYFMYFDVALTELWRASIGPYAEMTAAGTDMVVAEARARYLAPARFDENLDVSVRVTRVGVTGLSTEMTVTRDGTAIVRGEMRHVFIDMRSGEKTPIPKTVRSGLERHFVAPPPAQSRETDSVA